MTDEQMRVAIAEACPNIFATRRYGDGKTQVIAFRSRDVSGQVSTFDPLNDLNACHEMEKVLSGKEWDEYLRILEHSRDWLPPIWREVNPSRVIDFAQTHAPARQRCEAFIATIERKEEV